MFPSAPFQCLLIRGRKYAISGQNRGKEFTSYAFTAAKVEKHLVIVVVVQRDHACNVGNVRS